MRILFLDAYFEPEQIAFTHLEKDLLEGLVQAGHKVEIVCPTPTRGVSAEIAKKYKKSKSETLYDGRVHVTRFSAPQEGKNPVVRALRYFWCNLRSYQVGKKMRNIDVVFANSTPPTQGLLAGKLSKRLRCPFVYSLQDIFPDSLVTTGLAKQDSLIWKIGRWLENKTYGYADQIIVISESCKRNLRKKGVAESKLTLISNWVDIDQIKPIDRNENKLIGEYNIDPNKFLVVYAGNFGAAQGADVVLKAAKELIYQDEIQFIIFGGGAEYGAAVEYVKENNLTNVMINPLLPQDRVAEVYSLGDVALITCKAGVGNSGMPSKTWSIMACNTPIIASFDTDSDMADILNRADAGVCIAPDDAISLSETVMHLMNTENAYQGGQAFVKTYAEKKICVASYVEILKGSIN